MTATFVVLAIVGDPRFPTDASIYAANLSMFARIFGKPSMDGVYWSISSRSYSTAGLQC
jgi:hypothetical protein